MDWNYSNTLSDALLAARTNQTDLRYQNPPLYRPFFSSYDPLITKFKTRPNFYNRPVGSINIFDDIDDLALEVETDNLLTSRFRPINQINYVPSYFNNNNNNNNQIPENNLNSDYEIFDRPDGSINNKTNLIPQQPPKQAKKHSNNLRNQNRNSPQKVQNNSPQNKNREFESQNQPPINQNSTQPHNNQQQRFIQYQQRVAQQQQQPQLHPENSLSELELLKIKQQQDRQQLIASLGQNPNQIQNLNNQNIYAPFFQPNYLNKAQKQYSEASIPSTNADPLNSNNPTPPLFTQRNNNNNNNNQDYNKNNKFQATTKTSDDEPGSYLGALKETRLREQRLAKDKYTTHDYKKYQKNYGFGRDFLPFENETKEEKLEKAKKRDEYAKQVKERNTDKYTYNDIGSFGRRNQFQSDPIVNKRNNRK